MKILIKTLFLLPILIACFGKLAGIHATAQTFTTLHSFNGTDGGYPAGEMILSGSTLYGTAAPWGSDGTLFAVNVDGTGFRVVHSNLSSCLGALTLSGGTLYGVTAKGGDAAHGTLFKVNTDGTGFATLMSFGNYPYGGLVSSGNTLFGTTTGLNSAPAWVFAINTDGTSFRILYTLPGGSNPSAGLVLSGSTLYGATREGGAGGGAVFAIQTDGTGFRTLHNLASLTDGSKPYASLVLAGDTLYGTAEFGGNYGNGTVFAVKTNGTGFTTLRSFGQTSVFLEGSRPRGGLTLSGTTLYGTTLAGGSASGGTVFSLKTDGTAFTTLYNLDYHIEGASQETRVILSGNVLYGTTGSGGFPNLRGTVFSLSLPASQLPPNNSPTDMLLNSSSVAENAAMGTSAGTLSAVDPTAGDTHTFTLTSGIGDGDNSSFTIEGNTLKTAAVFNYEARNNYSVRIRAIDAGGLFYEKAFVVTILDANEAPFLAQPLPNLTGTLGLAFAYTFPQATFGDPDIGQSLAYTVSGLPLDVGFNASTRTFSGVPGTVGQFPVTLTATDNGAAALSASSVMMLTITYPSPTITTQPANLSIFEHQSASLAVVAAGSALTYQWQKDGQNIPGATSPNLILTDVLAYADGQYAVVVANPSGTVTSSAAHLAILPPAYVQNIANSLSSDVASRAAQSSLASLQTSFSTLIDTNLASRASQGSLAILQSLVSTNLDTNVLSRASQTSVDILGSNLSGVSNSVATKASQASLDAANASLTTVAANVSSVGTRLDITKSTVLASVQSNGLDLNNAIASTEAADQASLSALMAKLSFGLDTNLLSRASQTTAEEIKAKVDSLDTSKLDATVGSRATQISIDALLLGVDGRASQVTADAIKTRVDGLDLSLLDQSVSSRASEVTAQAIKAKIEALSLANLDVSVASRASQISVTGLIDLVDTNVFSRAAQTSVDAANAALGTLNGKLDTGLDAPVSSRASQATLELAISAIATANAKLEARLDQSVTSRSTQTSVDAANGALAVVDGKLAGRLDQTISSRASQTSLEAAHSSLTLANTKLNLELDTNLVSRASQASLIALQSRVDANEQKAEAFRDLSLRVQIERQLADANNRIALFCLPQANGGELEYVRDIVADTILLFQNVGMPVGKGPQYLASGNQAFAKKEYRQAYDNYALAYVAVVNKSGDNK